MLRIGTRGVLASARLAPRCPPFTRAPLCAPALRRLCDSAGPDADAGPKVDASGAYESEAVLFEGGKNTMVKTLKMASIANLGFALASAPLLHFITSQTGHEATGWAMSGLLVFFGAGTTGALTWATSTYVLAAHSVAGRAALRLTTPTFTGGSRDTEVAWADITRPVGYHPFVTFSAAGTKYYFDDVGTMHDPAMIPRLEEALSKS